MSKILIIDDEKDICFLISEILVDEKYITEYAINSSIALNKFTKFKPDLIILDVWLGNSDLDGIELLKKFKELNPLIPIIIISGHGTVDMAVNAIKCGAYDFIEKPFNSEKIIIVSKRAIESANLLQENNKLKSITIKQIPLIGNSNFIKKLNKEIIKIAHSNSRVFISGIVGAGKKLISQLIHQNSIYSNLLCFIVDFKNITENELAEMFTEDEININQNILVQANNNTLILDNIDMLPINYQQKLLLALENNKLFKNYKIYLKQKIISLSNKNIKDEIKKGNFIKNLYERLSTIKIEIPEINNRREDIVPICEYYLDYYNKNKKYKFSFSQKAKTKLELYRWPGNIPQIINYAQKTIILNHEFNNNSNYEIENLPMDMGDYEQKNKIEDSFDLSLKEARNNFERNYFISQIQRFNGNISKISNFTGMERTALYRKFKSLNINIENN